MPGVLDTADLIFSRIPHPPRLFDQSTHTKPGGSSEHSEPGYLGTQDNTGKTFLRGIQLSDDSGQVKFTTIYPGWCQGRVTHIHIEVFINSVLKLTSQLAFPDSLNTTVYKTSLYSTHGQNTLTNSTDGILSDSYNSELLTISGDATNDYSATFKIVNSHPVFSIRQNPAFPFPSDRYPG